MTEVRGRGQLRPSEELRAVTARHWAALRRHDPDAFIARLSMMDGVTFIGSDQSEYVDDPDSLVRYTWQQFDALPVFPVGEAQIDAWSEGDFGWAVVRSTVEAATVRGLRATIIFHLEQDEWKIVHGHFSVGAPNEEVFGTP